MCGISTGHYEDILWIYFRYFHSFTNFNNNKNDNNVLCSTFSIQCPEYFFVRYCAIFYLICSVCCIWSPAALCIIDSLVKRSNYAKDPQ